MRKHKKPPKFWKGLVVMCGEYPILIGAIDWDEENGYSYQEATSPFTWWSEDSLYRLTTFQAGFAKEHSQPGFPGSHVYYRRGN